MALEAALPDMPENLFNVIQQGCHPAPKEARTINPASQWQMPADTTPYGAKALGEELAALYATPEGQRNAQLNRAAFSLGQLVGGGVLDRGQVESALTAAAVNIGLSGGELRATIQSGITSGMGKPRTAPERVQRDSRVIGLDAKAPGSENADTAHLPLIYIPSWENCPPEVEVLLKLNETPVLHRSKPLYADCWRWHWQDCCTACSAFNAGMR